MMMGFLRPVLILPEDGYMTDEDGISYHTRFYETSDEIWLVQYSYPVEAEEGFGRGLPVIADTFAVLLSGETITETYAVSTQVLGFISRFGGGTVTIDRQDWVVPESADWKPGRWYAFRSGTGRRDCFETAVDSLFLKENCDVYITGSNAYFMSGELATLLTGRYVELSMTPLSFQEFCDGFSKKEQKAKEYMSGIYHTILLNDIVKRLKIADVNMLEEVTRFLMHNIGNRTSSAAIANTMVSNRKKNRPEDSGSLYPGAD